jgi:hypothetical protein
MKAAAGKKGQVKMSFGMIFSIILIVVFIAFAIYAISKFLDIQGSVNVGQFKEYLQSDIDSMWKSTQGSQEAEYSLPKKISYVCFVDYSSAKTGSKKDLYDEFKILYSGDENLFFYPIGSGGGTDSMVIEHIDTGKITGSENPFCLNNSNGKISMTIKKGTSEALVTITA